LSAFDAVRAMQVPLPAARRKLNDAGRLTALLQTARQELFPQLTAAAEQLRQSDIASQWIDERLQKITADANLLLHTATQRAVADELESLAAELAEVGASAQRTVELVTSIEEQVQPRLEAFTQRVESVREQLADELKLPITAVLNEPDRDPDDWLAAAREYLQTARQTLALGRNDAAQSALEAMQAAETQAETLLQASAQAVKSFAQEQQRARAELRQLGERVPRIEQQLEPIQRAYVPAALGMHFTAAATELEQAWEMEPADAPRQPATATEPLRIGVGDLLQRAAAPVGEIERLLQQAAAEQSQGRVLHAADMQQQVAFMLGHSHQQLELAQRHLLAIDTQRQENESVLARLGNRVQELQELSRDPQIMQDTLGAITAARRTLDALRRDLAAPPPAPNPFEIERSLQTLDRTLLQLDARCQADRQAHAEAARGLAGARRQLQAAQQLVRQAQTDDIPDSRPTRQASRQIDALAGKLAELEADLRAAHGDWQQAAERSSQLQIDLRAAANTLGGELQHASRAFSEFQAAARAVMQAERWSGDYGLRVKGSPGAVELERARSVLQQGNYGAVIELTMRAASSATAAIQKAEREVARRRMAAAQEAERKRRRAARRSSTWGSGSFGGGSFGGSSSRGGSFGGGSFGGSSSRGGSSGFKRSGW
ncbi:MAG: hypothetical protein KDA45_10410, partial [Planctomycetales bacterium]|nr:hypothetical protein [Planctomycetales bacterium]